MKSNDLPLQTLDLFNDGGSYIDCSRLFFSYFKQVPTIKTIGRLNLTRLTAWIEAEWAHRIITRHAKQSYTRKKNKLEYIDLFYLLDNGILLNAEANSITILHLSAQESEAMEMLSAFKRFTRRKKKTQEISLVVNTRHGLDTAAIKLRKPVVDMSVHYNADLQPQHEKILTTLKETNKSGLYLFHGVPGTGKSTYIRYLTRSIGKK